tara:strand:- start:946 stop:3381 length:2436 start_codon:yes stop_codon:yes gene_type:complete
MISNSSYRSGGKFPDPLVSKDIKDDVAYGLKYAKAIESQWNATNEENSLQEKRRRTFERNRDYAQGVQNTTIYKRLLTSLDPNAGDGSLLNLDYTPVPILPKFVRIVVNKILSRNPYPNLEAIDPLSSSEKDREKNRLRMQVAMKDELKKLKQETGGLVLDKDPESLPDTLEEAEIFLETNVKTDAEISAQIATAMTLSWNNFNDGTFRRCVNDLAALGMAVVKRHNDPNYGITTEYVDPCKFIHSYTEDPNFDDITYAGSIRTIPIQELKRLAGDQLTEEDYKKIAKKAKGNKSDAYQSNYDPATKRSGYGYDDHTVQILDFEFLSVDCMFFEEKTNRHGNTNFFYEGYSYKEKLNSMTERIAHKMDVTTVYEGMYIMGTDYVINYGQKHNIPKNIHDISKAKLSYSVVATNIGKMMPKSMVDSCIGFADMLQITHLKIQQAIAKAKPDGLIIDIEGLEGVEIGKGGELQPLDLHDIYEQTGVFYYRSKNAEGGFQNPPIREIGNTIRNINELIALYNHYLRLIRDATGINEAMDASSPKGEDLVGVREQAIAAGNNAIYDITNASMILYKKVCEDVVKCLQIIPPDSTLRTIYENAIGKENMKVLSSFSDLPMYNFGVQVHKEMESAEKQYLEQSIQIALGQKELDLEDAMMIRSMKDINQAERLLVVKRKKRQKEQQQMAQQNSQMQQQQAQQTAQQGAQLKQQEMQLQAQLDAQQVQIKAQAEIQVATALHELHKEIETIKAQATLGFKTDDQEFKEKIEVLKEDRKDDRLMVQTGQQRALQNERMNMQSPQQNINADELIDNALNN